MEFIDLRSQRRRIERNIRERMDRVLDHGQFVLGPEVIELENRLADFVGIKHCISVGNGTDALSISLRALGVLPGDEVIVPAFTFASPAEVVALHGATPIFADIDESTFNLDPEKLTNLITPRTKAIIAVSLFGQCADLDSILLIAKKHKIPLIEDAAQSFGAKTASGRRSCSMAQISCTSFFPSKPLGAYGDGGACFTADSFLAEQIRKIRSHGQTTKHIHGILGQNSRLDTIQAAVLLGKLEVFEDEISRRQKLASRYSESLKDSVQVPKILGQSVFAQYTIQSEKRDMLKQALEREHIPTAIHYPMPLHHQIPFQKYFSGELPKSERASQMVLSLPMHPYLSEAEQSQIIHAIRTAV